MTYITYLPLYVYIHIYIYSTAHLSHIWDVHHLVLCGHPSGKRRGGFLNPKPAIHAAGEGAPELVAVLGIRSRGNI